MITHLIDRLYEQGSLPAHHYREIVECSDPCAQSYLHAKAREVAQRTFSNKVYLRGLIEVTSFCRNNCYYCGLRASNRAAERYRLTHEQILGACREGYRLGLRTFVLQGGEDNLFDTQFVEQVVASIAAEFPDCAITLSLGEKSREEYERLFEAGASRYLLRHETFNAEHYAQLHPAAMSQSRRMEALRNLKDIGYQTGSGIMVGSPYQTIDHIIEDILFIEQFKPHMIGIGPFVSHHETPFAQMPNGDTNLTLRLLSIFRLVNPKALIPSTTALATLMHDGHKAGIMAGANVVMPNLTPSGERKKYAIYDNKASFGSEAAEGIAILGKSLGEIGYEISFERGDSPLIIE